MEDLCDLIGEDPLPTHPRAEPWIVEFATANGANPSQDLVLAFREVALQPFLKDRCDC